MSVTGPGCAACDFTGEVTTVDDRRPCDACGGFSQFRHRDEAVALLPAAGVLAGVPIASARGAGFAYAYTADELATWRASLAPEDDWRPLPSVAEVLAHNARTGGGDFGPWLCIPAEGRDVRVVWLGVAELHDATDPDPRVEDRPGFPWVDTRAPDARFRPITRRGGALPWPEVPR
jgi:hypothetical protein